MAILNFFSELDALLNSNYTHAPILLIFNFFALKRCILYVLLMCCRQYYFADTEEYRISVMRVGTIFLKKKKKIVGKFVKLEFHSHR
jgi:hypothetical protein